METEKIEYLLGRMPKSYKRSPFEQFPLAPLYTAYLLASPLRCCPAADVAALPCQGTRSLLPAQGRLDKAELHGQGQNEPARRGVRFLGSHGGRRARGHANAL